MGNFIVGLVTKYYSSDKCGYIEDAERNKYFFLFSNIIEKQKLTVGDKVSFLPFEELNGRNAKHISIIEYKKLNDEKLLIQSIRKEWLLEGRSENIAKLFYYSDEVGQLIDGTKCFVIGRKGTGKTAIGEYLHRQSSYNIFTEKLDFKSFPINDLYQKEDPKFSLQNKYITVWKCIIYGSILKMMSQNDKIDSQLLKILKSLFPQNDIETLERKIEKLTEVKFSFDVLGAKIGTEVGPKDSEFKQEQSYLEKSQTFENIIKNYIDDSKYYLIIDALDDDYSDIQKRDEYFYLLNGLFKATQEIKSIFNLNQFSIFPVVFLRDDIYRQIDDSDKMKWKDHFIRLYWDKNKMQNMLAYRISKTIDSSGLLYNFDTAFSKIFPFTEFNYRGENKKVFDFMLKNSYMRPRDFIMFIKLCCERAAKNNDVITKKSVFHSVDSFSKYLIEDIEYEIKPIIKEIGLIFSLLEQIRKSEFSFEEFENKFNEAKLKKTIKTDQSSESVLNILYDFNVLGNVTKNGTVIFKMYLNNKFSSLNFNEKIKIKEGLEVALGIIDTPMKG